MNNDKGRIFLSFNDLQRKYNIPGLLQELKSLTNSRDVNSYSKKNISNYGKIGIYTKEERAQKIMYYKSKLKKHRENHPVLKNYTGRSKIAKSKERVKGMFQPSKK